MSQMKRSVAFVHTSPAAVGPLMQFYAEAAPEFEITNLLDDGLLRLLAAGRAEDVRRTTLGDAPRRRRDLRARAGDGHLLIRLQRDDPNPWRATSRSPS